MAALEALPGPRRSAIGALAAELLATERALAGLYAAAVPHATDAAFRTGLEELGAAKAAHARLLAPLVEALRRDGPRASPPEAPPVPGADLTGRGALFPRAFPGERALAVGYRELAVLLGDPALFPPLVGLAAEAAVHRALLRELYLRYS